MSIWTIISAVATVVIAIVAVVELVFKIWERTGIQKIIKWRMIWIVILVVLFIVFASLTIFLWYLDEDDPSRYGFESGTMEWRARETDDSQGVTAIAQSEDHHRLGKHSLKLITDFEGGHTTRSKGEVYVSIDVQKLKDKPITVWVYVPKEALGESKKPNGIQVFAKDSVWRSEYGAWTDITSDTVDKWCEVTLTPSIIAPQGGSMTAGFDPAQILEVGVKVAIGEGSQDTYEGPIYIDAVDWPGKPGT
jgi:hypothetical protein